MPVEVSSSEPLPNFFGIRWGASREEAHAKMEQKGLIHDDGYSEGPNLAYHGGSLAGWDAKMWLLQFGNDKLHTGKVVIAPSSGDLADAFNDVNEWLQSKYGAPTGASTTSKKLYTFGEDGELAGSILTQVTEGHISVTYQHQELNVAAMSGSGGGCFVATATLGSASHPEVTLLRDFRDKILIQHAVGRVGIKVYYKVSPHFAMVIRKSQSLRKVSYMLLVSPSVKLANWLLNRN
jgi:hypothetical protein